MADTKNPQPGGAPPGEAAIDLPRELTQRIDAMTERLARVDYFAILGLARSATRAQVRQAFLTIAPQFHPDKYFGRNLGSYGPKMDRLFAQLSAAHDTLADDERRAAYTRGLPPEVPLTSPPPAGSDRPPPTPAVPTPPPTEAAAAIARARQQAFAAKLAGPKRTGTPMPGRIGTPLPGRIGTPMPGPAAAATPARTGTPVRAFEALRRPSSAGMPAVSAQAAVDALRRRYEETVAQSRGTTQSRGLANAAQGAAAKAQQHADAIKLAKEFEEKQEHQEAGIQWARAYDLAASGDTAHRASLCFRRGGDLRRAAKYGDEAVKLDPLKANYHVNLALVYADLGMALRARGEIERAHTIDPQSNQVKEAVIRIKAMR